MRLVLDVIILTIFFLLKLKIFHSEVVVALHIRKGVFVQKK